MSDYTDKICPIIYSSDCWLPRCLGEKCAWFSKCYTPTSEDCSVVGEWIVSAEGDSICSNCGAFEEKFIYGVDYWHGRGESKFCPNCGKKMKGAE